MHHSMIMPTKESIEIQLRKDISARFSAWLTHNKITMSDVTRKSGLSLAGLSLVRSGSRLPRASTLYGLTKAGMDINWLLTGEIKKY